MALLMAFLARQGMPTAVRSIHRKHVEAFIAAELERTEPSSAATRYRSLQQLFGWLDEEGEINGSPMAKTRPPKILEKPVPVLLDDDVRRLLADCSGKDFRDRRDLAIIRRFPVHRDAASGCGRGHRRAGQETCHKGQTSATRSFRRPDTDDRTVALQGIAQAGRQLTGLTCRTPCFPDPARGASLPTVTARRVGARDMRLICAGIPMDCRHSCTLCL